VELVEDTETGLLAAVKAMPLHWICESNQAFVAANPLEIEKPWIDISVTRYLSLEVGLQCVCRFVGVFLRRADNSICLVVSYCAGGDLFTCLQRGLLELTQGESREDTVRPIIRRVMEAVVQIHQTGVAHGDLSLENVMLMDETQHPQAADIRVIDFGCSSGPDAAGLRGKPSYQAPEIHQSGMYDGFKADAFSVGVMIFMLVAGNYPWRSTRPGPAGCQCWHFYAEMGLPAFLAKRKIVDGQRRVALADVFSPLLVELLDSLFCSDPLQRLSVADALNCQWFYPSA